LRLTCISFEFGKALNHISACHNPLCTIIENKVFSFLGIKNLPDNIVFTGYVDDIELVNLYNKASIFIYPSFFEGFGIPPLEAQACGTPVICSNTTSLPEVGKDSVVYCDPYDLKDIREKIELVMNDETLQKELRQKGFENIKRFSWKKSANKMIEIIESMHKIKNKN